MSEDKKTLLELKKLKKYFPVRRGVYIKAIEDVSFKITEGEKFGVVDNQNVKVKIETEGRSLIFDDVVVRISPKYAAAMHIDTDESNAAGIAGAVDGIIITD